MKEKIYDLIIIGGGAAGVTAAMYASVTDMKVLLIEKNQIGAGVKSMDKIITYPGILSIDGDKLAKVFDTQVKNTGIDILIDEVYGTQLNGEIKEVKCTKKTFYTKSVIIATGTNVKNLELKNEAHYIGRGLSYSANLDREKYVGKIVTVFGGGVTALKSALYLSEKAKTVYLVSRREGFMGDLILYNKVKETKNIKIILSSKINDLCGDNELNEIIVENIITKKTQNIATNCIFVAMGRGTDTDFVSGIEKSQEGFIITDPKMQTSINGVYAAGDIRNTELRDIVTAMSDGAIASISAYNYLNKVNGKSYE